MDIQRSENCGNSPKNLLIETFVERLLRGEGLSGALPEEAAIEVSGREGRLAAREFGLRQLCEEALRGAVIFDAVSHGRKGAVDFDLLLADGRRLPVGLFVEFASLKADAFKSLKFIRGALEAESPAMHAGAHA